jgi:hypothetical protein
MNGNNRIKTQFSLRAVVALTVASAVWVWLFSEAKPVEIAVFSGVALTAGIVGHVVYRYCLPWRVTVVAMVLLLYNAVLLALEVLHDGSNPLELLLQVAVGPAEMLMHVKWHWHRHTVFKLAMVLGTLLFTPAHSIRPSLPTAIITALGVGFWYGSSILMLTYAG